jgi:hypothetical protein
LREAGVHESTTPRVPRREFESVAFPEAPETVHVPGSSARRCHVTANVSEGDPLLVDRGVEPGQSEGAGASRFGATRQVA